MHPLRWRRSTRACIVVIAVITAVLVLAKTRKDPANGPAAPYEHSAFSEISVATEDVVAGQGEHCRDGAERRGLLVRAATPQ